MWKLKFSIKVVLNKLDGIKSHADTITDDNILKKETDEEAYA